MTWRLISVRTLSRVRVRKWVAPIQALRVPNGCSTVCRHAHSLGHAVEPVLHPVEHVLIHPALDATQLGRRAPGFERTGETGAQVAVEIEVLGVICPTFGLGEFRPRRAGVMIVLGVVDEVLPGEEAALGAARRQGLGYDRRDARAFAGQDLVAVEVAAVGQGGDLLAT